ncbi:hypothetical protein ABEV41_00615 [Geobacillus thermodenitrificans]|jgi:hypothetical protein|uniref:hypothetical protein n=1 Tax=Geobacillus thermodenitrificans TaxID=33940 RepID=UPI003D21D843
MKGKYIEIGFENCESIVIPIDRIKELKYGNLEELTDERGFYEVNTYKTDYVLLSISYNDESELKYNSLEQDEPLGMYIGNPMSNNVEDRPNILGRITEHNDIVTIDTLNENQERIKTVYVPWHEEDEYNNRLMSVKANSGLLTIEIKSN